MAVKKVAKSASKPSAKKVKKSAGPATKKATKKSASKPAAKKSTKKATATTPKATKKTQKAPRPAAARKTGGVDFPAGSDMLVVWEEVLKGGESRRAVLENCRERFQGQTTSGGNEKPVSTILNQVLSRAQESGYEIVQHWTVKPGDKVKAKEAVTPEPSKKDKKVKSTKKPSAAKKKVAKKK